MKQTHVLTHHNSSLFSKPLKSENINIEDDEKNRSPSSCSSSSIDAEFTHFKPIKTAPIHSFEFTSLVFKPVPRNILKENESQFAHIWQQDQKEWLKADLKKKLKNSNKTQKAKSKEKFKS